MVEGFPQEPEHTELPAASATSAEQIPAVDRKTAVEAQIEAFIAEELHKANGLGAYAPSLGKGRSV